MILYFQHDNVTIYCGECSEVMQEVLSDNSIDLTITSPPYDKLRKYEGYIFDFVSIAKQLWRVTKKGGVVVWVVGDQTINGSETLTCFKQALYFKELGFNVHDTMIYQTDKPPMNDNRYQSSFEYMFVFSKGRPRAFNPLCRPAFNAGLQRVGITYREKNGTKKNQWRGGTVNITTIRENIWYIPAGWGKSTLDKYAFNHPAIFPEALARDHIISWSNPSDLVFDPMLGSGTTLKMAVLTKRKFIGIEISEKYCEIAVKRYESALKELEGYTPQEIKKNIDITNKRLF